MIDWGASLKNAGKRCASTSIASSWHEQDIKDGKGNNVTGPFVYKKAGINQLSSWWILNTVCPGFFFIHRRIAYSSPGIAKSFKYSRNLESVDNTNWDLPREDLYTSRDFINE